jgi:hypothetical protein
VTDELDRILDAVEHLAPGIFRHVPREAGAAIARRTPDTWSMAARVREVHAELMRAAGFER